MEAHDRIVKLIPDYVVDALPAGDCDTVRQHVHDCAACRELLETAVELRETLPAGFERLLDHPHAALLDAYSLDASRLEPATSEWIGTHLRSCEVCGEVVERLQAPQQEAQAARRPTRKPGLATWLAGALLQPGLAAAYLLLLIIAMPFAVRGLLPESPSASSGIEIAAPARTLYGVEQFRGGEGAAVEPETVPLPATGPLELRLAAGLTPEDWEPGRRVLLELRDPSGGVESRALTPADPDDAGSLLLRLPRSGLANPGVWTAVVGGAQQDGPIDSPLFRAAFRVDPR